MPARVMLPIPDGWLSVCISMMIAWAWPYYCRLKIDNHVFVGIIGLFDPQACWCSDAINELDIQAFMMVGVL